MSLTAAESSLLSKNYKGLLQEHCQKIKVELPHYTVESKKAREACTFHATVTVVDRSFTSSSGFSTKKQAEQNAAKVAARSLNLLPSCVDDVANNGSTQPREASPAPNAAGNQEISGVVKENPSIVRIPQCAVSKLPTSPVSYKNLLQENAQKLGFALPVYDTQWSDGTFVSVVTLSGQSFRSIGVHRAKKPAEQSAASVALDSLVLGPISRECGMSMSAMRSCSTPFSDNANVTSPVFDLGTPVPGPQHVNTKARKTETEVSWKNLLQEHMQQCGMGLPIYKTTMEGAGFICCLEMRDRDFLPPTSVCPNKKQAEQMAAKGGLIFLGLNPEEVVAFKGQAKQRARKKHGGIPLPRPGERASWIRPNRNMTPKFDTSWEEMDYFWEQSINKRRKLDTTTVDQQFWNFPVFDSRPFMSVGEVWKEKRNIVLVGNTQTSFILYCTAVQGSCQLFCEKAQCLVTLQPGHRIIGLDAQYVQARGIVALEAAQCLDIAFPPSPDPVLTSCGVVLLYQDPEHRSGVQVLLKRYLLSQAFINVLAALAQYFRREVAGRPIRLDIENCVEHIRKWMLQEVRHIAVMDEASLREVFAHMWKFDKRWCMVLKPPLPRDLQELQALATEELARRQVSGIDHPDDFYRPWSLPRGNFKHRSLSTGFLMESPAECAVRELREETGIHLDTGKVEMLPYVDLPRVDNLNPHCGDTIRYYLYVYTSESTSDDEDMATTDADSSIAWEADPSQGEGMPFTPDQPLSFSNTKSPETTPKNSECTPVKNSELQIQDNQPSTEDCVQRCQLSQNKKAEGALEQDKIEDLDTEDKKPEGPVSGNFLVQDAQLSLQGPPQHRTVEDVEQNKTNDPGTEGKESNCCDTEHEGECVKGTAAVVSQMHQVPGTVLIDCKGPVSERLEVHSAALKGTECNTGTPHQKRGLKRKRGFDREDEPYSPENPLGESSDSITVPVKSPHVQGGVHEECAWLPLNEATEKSPVFGQIYKTFQFMKLLDSMEVQ